MCVECKRNAKCSGYNEDGVNCYSSTRNAFARFRRGARCEVFSFSRGFDPHQQAAPKKQSYYGLDVVVVVVVWLGELPLLQVVVF